MNSNEQITEAATGFERDCRSDFEKAVTALIALAFLHQEQGAEFLWDSDPELDAEANRILRGLSDSVAQAARKRARMVIEAFGWSVTDGAADDDTVERLDQQGSFLKELLEIWVALAFVDGIGKEELRINVMRYLSNPYASPHWARLPKGLASWGTGYQTNILKQMQTIGFGEITDLVRSAEQEDAERKGADYYTIHRGSGYLCPACDARCGVRIPISVPFHKTHARCVCWVDYHYPG